MRRPKDGFYEKNPILQTPLKELTNKEPTENSRGLRFGNMVQMRDLWAEEIEAALAGQEDRQGSAGRSRRARQCDVADVRKDGKIDDRTPRLPPRAGEGASLASRKQA